MPMSTQRRRSALVLFFVVLFLSVASPDRSVAADVHFTIGKYHKLSQAAAANDKAAEDSLIFYLGGFWNMIVASSDANAKAGIKRVFCLPQRASPIRLREAIDAELAAHPAHYAGRQGDSFEVLALIVIERRWPCK